MARKNKLLGIGVVAVLSVSLAFPVFASQKERVNVHTISYVDNASTAANMGTPVIGEDYTFLSTRSKKDAVGYMIFTLERELSYRAGKSGLYLNERFYTDSRNKVHILLADLVPSAEEEEEEEETKSGKSSSKTKQETEESTEAEEPIEYTADDYDKNKWFMDNDGRWYAFDVNGDMVAGAVKWGGEYFILDPNQSEYGSLIHENGFYNINNKLVHLTFDNTHNGVYGCITSGLEFIE